MSLKRRLQRNITQKAYPSWCADSWVLHQILRKLGFEPDDIYFDCHDTIGVGGAITRNAILVSVKQGETTFTVNLGQVESPPEETLSLWAEFVVNVNHYSTDAEHAVIWNSSELEKKLPRVELILQMIGKGIRIPNMPADEVETLRRLREEKNTGENL